MISTALRAVYFEIRVPDGIMSAYAPVMIQYTPSPARFMSMIDPLLPVGILMRCLAGKFLLGPSINELVTDGNTKLCCRSFILVLFQSTTANKIDSEHTQGYKRLLPVCEAEILLVTLKRIEVLPIFYVDF